MEGVTNFPSSEEKESVYCYSYGRTCDAKASQCGFRLVPVGPSFNKLAASDEFEFRNNDLRTIRMYESDVDQHNEAQRTRSCCAASASPVDSEPAAACLRPYGISVLQRKARSPRRDSRVSGTPGCTVGPRRHLPRQPAVSLTTPPSYSDRRANHQASCLARAYVSLKRI